MPGDRRIGQARSGSCPAASNSSHKARYAVSLPFARTQPIAFARENLSTSDYRRSPDRPTPKAACPSAHETRPATKDKTAGPNRGARIRFSGADLLAAGATDMTMRTNPSFDPIFLRFAISANNNRATRMVLSNFRNELRV